MKVSITIAEKHDGTFEVLYCGTDTTQAMDACLNYHEPDTKEVCMFRKPFHYKRRVPGAPAHHGKATSNSIMARHLFGYKPKSVPDGPMTEPPAPEAISTAPPPEAATVEQSAETFLEDAPAPASEPVPPKSRKRK